MLENQRIRLSKKMLKDALTKLLNEKSIHKISVIEVCNEAQINRTTFYKYYGSQYDLLKDMENDILSQIDIYLSAADGFKDNSQQQLIKITTFICDNIDLCKMLLNNNVDHEFPEKLINLPSIRRHINQLSHEYSEGKITYIFNFVINGGYSIVKNWINNEHRESPEEISAFIVELIKGLFPLTTGV